ncbi:hypothetical protein K438DRAFT_1769531 [Mycena galopus ATCC 62051]|nr:hypothetical protein K438DRAFT_1769531 [Mycena galopus ATCC 62051]
MPSEGHMTSKERKVKKDKTDSESHADICPLRELSPVRGNIERGNEKARKVLEKGRVEGGRDTHQLYGRRICEVESLSGNRGRRREYMSRPTNSCCRHQSEKCLAWDCGWSALVRAKRDMRGPKVARAERYTDLLSAKEVLKGFEVAAAPKYVLVGG